MSTLISTYFAENSSARAEVKKSSDSYQIEYFDQGGNLYHTEILQVKPFVMLKMLPKIGQLESRC